MLLQINVVIHCILVAVALNIDIPTLDMFVIIPISYLLMAIPISINGIGLIGCSALKKSYRTLINDSIERRPVILMRSRRSTWSWGSWGRKSVWSSIA